MEVTVKDMMEARDRRAETQRQLLDEYGQTLLCFTMNIPGPEKYNPLIREGFALGQEMLRRSLARAGIEPLYQAARFSITGCEGFYALPMPPLEAKRLSVDIEESSSLGRLFDMDVLRPDGAKVEREVVGLPPRRCMICGKATSACARSRAHTVSELQEKTRSILQDAIRREKCGTIARLACQALLYEVLTTPKPGLVDRLNQGSHRDMDVFTFAASVPALHPYFETCAQIGMDTAGESAAHAFAALRLPGRMAEDAMLAATGGVNTHKGAIFSIGILCAAAGRLAKTDWYPDRLLDACAEMTEGLTTRDFASLTPETARTFGQKLYLSHGIAGVRGEAERGFPLVRQYGLPKLTEALAAGLSMNDAGCAALVALMSHNTDTNVIHRSSLEKHQQVAARAEALLDNKPFPSSAELAEFDAELIADNISPGGSADLLAMCFLLYSLKEAAS